MRLPTPKLPGLGSLREKLPFGRRADADGNESPPGDDRPSFAARLRRLAAPVAGLVALAGLGAIVGWLWMNAEETASRRMAETPSARVSLVAKEEMAPATPAPAAEGKEAAATPPQMGQPSPFTGRQPAPLAPQAAPEAPPQTALAPPDPSLIEQSEAGPLPKVAEDGREPWKVYARPFRDDGRPKVAVIVTGLGLSTAASEIAVQDLPGSVTLSFAPYAKRLDEWIAFARAAGHEVLIDLPMEPIDFPRSDPGPYTLLTSLSTVENLNRLEWALSRVTGYVGVVNHMGGQFTTAEEALMPVLQLLKKRGLMLIDSRATSRSLAVDLAATVQLPTAFATRTIDVEASRQGIDRRLADIERVAVETGTAVAIAQPYPVTFERLGAWIATLPQKGITLAPITAVADKQSAR